MKICFATYEGVPIARGGPYIKIMECKKELEKLDMKLSFLICGHQLIN